MAARIVDLRLVLTREGTLRASVDGRDVPVPPTNEPSVVLAAIALRLEALAWSNARPQLEEVGDAASDLYRGGRT